MLCHPKLFHPFPLERQRKVETKTSNSTVFNLSKPRIKRRNQDLWNATMAGWFRDGTTLFQELGFPNCMEHPSFATHLWHMDNVGVLCLSQVVAAVRNLPLQTEQVQHLVVLIPLCNSSPIGWHTIWLFNIAMENGPFIDVFPLKPPFIGDSPWLC